MASGRVFGSFRDPSGFLFSQDGALFRQINQCYRHHYDHLITSNLYANLVDDGTLIPHEEVDAGPFEAGEAYKIIKPERVPFISYPYEWCFSQLRDAALLTLHAQLVALEHDMILKDCSAYNVQFRRGKPVFIDTLSFERYEEGAPWVAYRQFCQHFLAPLALMAYRDVRLGRLLAVHLDGIPVEMASSLLPFRSRLNFSLLVHLHLHAHYQQKPSELAGRPVTARMNRQALLTLVRDLETVIESLHWTPEGTPWGDYYDETSYSTAAFARKRQLVIEYLDRMQPQTVWDLGANTGIFSRIAAEAGCLTLAFDSDYGAIEKGYRASREARVENLLPLVLDLANPSPGLGWMLRERASLLERGPADLVMVLALMHHLAISNNVPFPMLASALAEMGKTLIIEFVPLKDSQVQRMIALRDDDFTTYTQQAFEAAFAPYFKTLACDTIPDVNRVLYLMERVK